MMIKKIIKMSFVLAIIIAAFCLPAIYFYNKQPVYIYMDERRVKISENSDNANTCLSVCSIDSPQFGYSLHHINILRQHLEMTGAKLFLVLNDDNLALNKFLKAQLLRMNLLYLKNYHDKKGELQKKYNINVLPTMLVFNKKGKLVGKIEGFVPWSERSHIESILKLL